MTWLLIALFIGACLGLVYAACYLSGTIAQDEERRDR